LISELAWAVRCDGKAVALAAILHMGHTARAFLMRVQWHGKTMAAGGAGRWEQSLCGGRWHFSAHFVSILKFGRSTTKRCCWLS